MTKLLGIGIALWLAAMSPSSAYAQSHIFGDWATGVATDSSYLYAATVNDSGNVLGQYCYLTEKGCVYLLGMHTSCIKGHRYPVLVNSDVGALQLEVLCNGLLVTGIYQYVFTDFTSIDHAVRTATRIGIAVPLRDDEFIVVRFALDGSAEALDVMRNNATHPAEQPHQGTRDQRL